uniref:KIND domain-containing protein n=2 Tax=Anolis carolinensis TaxID=28377 RepID=G1KYN0_ANOCA|nr:PREDICTED: protein spire homolog 1 isoform X1 [Anolis carolinensis]|eukprot:XP_008106071.1 PREDICTED: protein spire homolog 1 isoform X1 [Anolis carolinensis]
MVGGKNSSNGDLTKISLAEFLSYYEQPINEEQAWAICFQSCYKMKQILDQGLDSVSHMTILDIDNLYIHSDGSVSFNLQHDIENHISLEPNDALEDKMTELLGMLIYKALDWGIESNMERELSEDLEKLIRFMVKLNTGTTKATIAFQDVIKICEDHFLEPSKAASHYTGICKLLFAEYSECQKLMFTIQSCKEVLREMDMEDHTEPQKVDLWQGVLGDVQKGVKLQTARKQLPHKPLPNEGLQLSYSAVLDDIKNKRYVLHKASVRKRKERPYQKLSLHDQLMMEVKNPPMLRPTLTERSHSYRKENCQKFVLNSPSASIFSEQKSSTLHISNAKKLRLDCTTSGPESKSLPIYNQKTYTAVSLPTIADLMGTRYSEMKNSIQTDLCISSRAQVCPVCRNQYFIWPYMCHLCSSVICQDCCIKISMPVRHCIRLPLNFFEVIRLTKKEYLVQKDQKTAQLLYAVEHWDSTRVPLVLEPHCVLPPLSSLTKSMMDWPFMDICTKCEQYLLKILYQQSSCTKRSVLSTVLE